MPYQNIIKLNFYIFNLQLKLLIILTGVPKLKSIFIHSMRKRFSGKFNSNRMKDMMRGNLLTELLN